MPKTDRSRAKLGLWLLLLTLGGLASRRPGLPEFVISYVGDVLWGAFFFVLFASVWPRAGALWLWLGATLTTELIEFSQLYRAPWIEALRSTRLGGLLLGHVFLWSDVASVALGATLALASAAASTVCGNRARGKHCRWCWFLGKRARSPRRVA